MAEQQQVNNKKNLTIFGTETEFIGTLEFSDKLVIAGKFSGKISAPTGELEIAKDAVCEVEEIDAKSIVISGNIKGNMNASERVEICSGSSVESDIKTARFRIANNVEYYGQVSMLENEPDVDLFSVASTDFKQAMIVHSDVVR